ncbi:MAG TPA: ester cyclase [Gaiellaceae bacterium]|nr:ester cyclase [Gaiellaceae bacterium]
MTGVERIAAAWNKAFNAHDEERIRELIDERAALTAPGDVALEGRDAIVEYTMRWLNAFPDATIRVERQIVSGDWVVQQYAFEGTHSDTLTGPAGDIPATGRRLTGPVADVTRIENGVMVETHLYFDQVNLLTQLGLMPELARA